MLAEKLNMNVEDAESWIVNLIRNAEMDAKIDSKKVCHWLTYPIFNQMLLRFTNPLSFCIISLTLGPRIHGNTHGISLSADS